MSILSNLKPPAGAKRSRERVGRGIGGKGKTCGKGQKGQKSRAGSMGRLGFEGGQTPMYRRLPKRGFNNHDFATEVANINVGQLDAFDDGAEVTVDLLRLRGLVKGRFDAVKVLGNGEVNKKLTVRAHGFSKGARAKIEAAGGVAEVVSRSAASPASGSGSPEGDTKPEGD
ncbi:MAG: 50S ribosomal protein L15 [Myxococcota bacterium]